MDSGLVHWNKRCPGCQSFFSSSKMEEGELCPECQRKAERRSGGSGRKVQASGRSPSGRDVDVTLYAESGRVIGHGAFGTVYKIKSKVDGRRTEYVALKEPKFGDEDVAAEAALLEGLRHPNLVSLRFQLKRHGLRMMATELVSDGDLYHFIMNWYDTGSGLGLYTEVFGFQLFRGLGYLHYHDIVHRDVKPENLLVSSSTGLLKICDFGCAKRLLPDRLRDSCCVGTKEFRAPELLLHSKFTTPAVDVWSASVVMTEMAGGKPVFGEGPKTEEDQLVRIASYLGPPRIRHSPGSGSSSRASRVARAIEEQRRDDFRRRDFRDYCSDLPGISGTGRSEDFRDLLEGNLRYRPSERLAAYDVCAHEFFSPLFSAGAALPNGNSLPSTLFVFQREEVNHMSKKAAKRLSSHIPASAARSMGDGLPDDILGGADFF